MVRSNTYLKSEYTFFLTYLYFFSRFMSSQNIFTYSNIIVLFSKILRLQSLLVCKYKVHSVLVQSSQCARTKLIVCQYKVHSFWLSKFLLLWYYKVYSFIFESFSWSCKHLLLRYYIVQSFWEANKIYSYDSNKFMASGSKVFKLIRNYYCSTKFIASYFKVLFQNYKPSCIFFFLYIPTDQVRHICGDKKLY